MKSAEFQRIYGRGEQPVIATGKPQIRLPKFSQPNKTEAEYAELLKREFPEAQIIYEGITLHLPSGTRYTPDFTIWTKYFRQAQLALVVETKGPHIHSAASLRAFKEARAAFPFLKFRFCQKIKGEWRIAE